MEKKTGITIRHTLTTVNPGDELSREEQIYAALRKDENFSNHVNLAILKKLATEKKTPDYGAKCDEGVMENLIHKLAAFLAAQEDTFNIQYKENSLFDEACASLSYCLAVSSLEPAPEKKPTMER